MKGWWIAGVVATALLLAAVAAGTFVAVRPADVPRVSAPTPAAIEAAVLELAVAPRFTRVVQAATSMPGSQRLLDQCQGPVAIDLGGTHPTLVAEHNYCGGNGWISRLKSGEIVDLAGQGVDAGRYVVTEIAYGQRRVSRLSDLPETDIVLQTCVSATKIVMIGLESQSEQAA